MSHSKMQSATVKTCRVCHVEQSLERFYRCKGMRDGYHGACKVCMLIHQKNYNQRMKAKAQAEKEIA